MLQINILDSNSRLRARRTLSRKLSHASINLVATVATFPRICVAPLLHNVLRQIVEFPEHEG